MNIPFVPADPSNYYSGRGGNSIKYIVMHYTANDGDTDEGNAHYFQGAGRRASAHYFVDEDSVTQSVRDNDAAWHCGGDLESSHHPLRGICMNRWQVHHHAADGRPCRRVGQASHGEVRH